MKIVRSVLLPAVIVSIALLGVWKAHRPAPAAQSDMEQVRQEAERGAYRLIDIEALGQLYHTDRKKLLLVDTRQEWEYRAGHIEGSVNFPMEPTSWARWKKKGDLETFLGPDRNQTIIFY